MLRHLIWGDYDDDYDCAEITKWWLCHCVRINMSKNEYDFVCYWSATPELGSMVPFNVTQQMNYHE